jgi:Domain of unknown function (DUF4388)
MATQTAVTHARGETNEALASRGFAGSLRCASLADLVQLQCLSRARAAVAVRSNGREGELYFDGGEIIHAKTSELTGDEAAFEILSWEGGSFGTLDLECSPQPSMTAPWQHLLLLAAQRQDEKLHAQPEDPGSESSALEKAPEKSTLRPLANMRGGLLVPRPATPSAAAVPSAAPTAPKEERLTKAAAVPAQSKLLLGLTEDLQQQVTCVVRLRQDGQILDGQGDAPRLAALGNYLRGIVELIGEEVGLSGFRVFEGHSSTRQLLLYQDSAETLVAIELLPGRELGHLRSALGC